MKKIELLECVQRLSEKWKNTFGLYTYYVGYLTADLIISLLYVWRTSEPEEFEGLTGEKMRLLLDEKIIKLNEEYGLKLSFFPSNSDIDTVIPQLIKELNNYDLSESNLPKEDWKEFIDYLLTKKSN